MTGHPTATPSLDADGPQLLPAFTAAVLVAIVLIALVIAAPGLLTLGLAVSAVLTLTVLIIALLSRIIGPGD